MVATDALKIEIGQNTSFLSPDVFDLPRLETETERIDFFRGLANSLGESDRPRPLNPLFMLKVFLKIQHNPSLLRHHVRELEKWWMALRQDGWVRVPEDVKKEIEQTDDSDLIKAYKGSQLYTMLQATCLMLMTKCQTSNIPWFMDLRDEMPTDQQQQFLIPSGRLITVRSTGSVCEENVSLTREEFELVYEISMRVMPKDMLSKAVHAVEGYRSLSLQVLDDSWPAKFLKDAKMRLGPASTEKPLSRLEQGLLFVGLGSPNR